MRSPRGAPQFALAGTGLSVAAKHRQRAETDPFRFSPRWRRDPSSPKWVWNPGRLVILILVLEAGQEVAHRVEPGPLVVVPLHRGFRGRTGCRSSGTSLPWRPWKRPTCPGTADPWVRASTDGPDRVAEMMKRVRRSDYVTENHSLLRWTPPSTIIRSNNGAWTMNCSYCPSVVKPIYTFDTGPVCTRRSRNTISPATAGTDVPLEVPLGLLPATGFAQRDDPGAWHGFRCSMRRVMVPIASGVSALEQDDVPLTGFCRRVL